MRHYEKYFTASILSIMFAILLAGNLLVSFAQGQLPPPLPPPPPPPKDQPKDPDEDKGGTIKIKADLVLLDVSVLDKSNKFVKGISQNKFQVFEDQISQKIEFFSQDQVPISYGIVV